LNSTSSTADIFSSAVAANLFSKPAAVLKVSQVYTALHAFYQHPNTSSSSYGTLFVLERCGDPNGVPEEA
jgi:hypothetical protein